VLFMHGGASAQFSMIPLNLLGADDVADYVETGHWARRARGEASRYGTIHTVASNQTMSPPRLPPIEKWHFNPSARYCHITANETADGLEFNGAPPSGGAPLIADMTSNLLSRPIDVSAYGMIYAGAQKNIGPAGLTIVIIRDDLLGDARPETPSVFNYARQIEANGRINTPLTYAVYLAGLVLDWLDEEGGLLAAADRNRRKSEKLYAAIDDSEFYQCVVTPSDRSRMNVCFGLADHDLEERFLSHAEASGLLNLKGHAASGALRASLYNAMPESGVDALIDFMEEFAASDGRGEIVGHETP
jgi:phosphoserine aminotransferase